MSDMYVYRLANYIYQINVTWQILSETFETGPYIKIKLNTFSHFSATPSGSPRNQ